MRRTLVLAIAAAFTLLVASVTTYACSTFASQTKHGMILGRNTDSGLPVPGFFVVNKRGIYKIALPWGTLAPAEAQQAVPTWTARYGSVTATAFGREFPDGGMNEMGLVVEEMTLNETEYPAVGADRAIFHQQWIQYQLDRYATVEEVVQNIGTVSPRGWGWHFMVADPSGDCATIEFINGKAVINRGGYVSKHVTGCVLTNDTVESSLEELKNYKGFGGSTAVPESRDSAARFVRASARLENFVAQSDEHMIAVAFDILGDVAQGTDTIRSIVHNLSSRKIYFRTAAEPDVKSIDLSRLDFSPHSPVRMIEIDSPLSGDVTDRLHPYSDDVNLQVVRDFVRLILASDAARRMLEAELNSVSMTLGEYVQTMATYPHTTRIAASPATRMEPITSSKSIPKAIALGTY